MCLDRITRSVKWKTTRSGWKCLSVFRSQYSFPCFHHHKPLKFGVWLKANKGRISIRRGVGYPRGFHVYVKRSRRFGNCTLRCRVRGVHTLGIQNGQQVMVAKWIKILPPKKRGR